MQTIPDSQISQHHLPNHRMPIGALLNGYYRTPTNHQQLTHGSLPGILACTLEYSHTLVSPTPCPRDSLVKCSTVWDRNGTYSCQSSEAVRACTWRVDPFYLCQHVSRLQQTFCARALKFVHSCYLTPSWKRQHMGSKQKKGKTRVLVTDKHTNRLCRSRPFVAVHSSLPCSEE